MNDQERMYYEILKFLAEPNVRRDSNVTDEVIQDKFRGIDVKLFADSIFALQREDAIRRTSANNQWQISDIGERELNRLKNLVDAETKSITISSKKKTLSRNLLSTFNNLQIVTGAFTVGLIIFGIGYYFGTEKVNQEMVDLKIKHERMMYEKSLIP